MAVTNNPADFGFLLDSQLYPNNSIVTVNDIGIKNFNGPALYCLTPSTECCETPSEANVTREWYLPDGRQLSSADTIFTREQVSSAVSLYRIRDGGTSPTGVFRCDVPDSSGSSRNIYVGLYPQTHGET